MQWAFDVARIALTLPFMLYASISDYKNREVSNSVWMLFAPPAFALTFMELFLFKTSELTSYGLCFGLTAFFALVLFYAGGFGGADAKALMCLALALPFYPEGLLTPLSGEVSPISKAFFPLAIFSNSVLLAVIPVLWIVLRNILWRSRTSRKLFEGDQRVESFGKKLLVVVTGYKTSISKLKEKWHVYPLEDIEETPEKGVKRKLIVLPKDEGRTAIVDRLDKAINAGTIEDGVWASPGLPMLVLITVGLVVALFLGDVIWLFVSFLFG
jgi:preflagellin peptidase FlaK